ncbi:MAG: hypothetical protein H7Y15_01435, partial [Pseudonocardia sp.]|nr:hypothetical protein [Pseudonocardia sp.]
MLDSLAARLGDAVEGLFDGVVAVLLLPTPLPTDRAAFGGVYDDVVQISAMIVLLLFLVTLLSAVFRLDPRGAVSGLAGIVQWGLAWAAGLALAGILVTASDALARGP